VGCGALTAISSGGVLEGDDPCSTDRKSAGDGDLGEAAIAADPDRDDRLLSVSSGATPIKL